MKKYMKNKYLKPIWVDKHHSIISISKLKSSLQRLNFNSMNKKSKTTGTGILRITLRDWLKFTKPLRHRFLSLAIIYSSKLDQTDVSFLDL